MQKFLKIFLVIVVFCILNVSKSAATKTENFCVENKSIVKSCKQDSKLGCYERKSVYDKIKGYAYIDTKCNYGCESGVCLKESNKEESQENEKNAEAETEQSKLEKTEEAKSQIIIPPQETHEITVEKEKLVISNDGLTMNNVKQLDDESAILKIQDKGFRVHLTDKKIILDEFTAGGFKVESKISLVYEDGSLKSGKDNKEIKVFPSDIKQKITGITSIKLVDEGSPKYLVDSKEQGKLFGFIPVSVHIINEVDAQSGEITKIKKPWWKFLTKKIPENAGDGDFCWINSADPIPEYECASELRCEDVLNTSDTIGLCRQYPAAFHGRIVFAWESWSEAEQYFRENWPSIPFSEAREWLHETEDGVEVTFYKWIDWFVRANSDDVSGMKAHFTPYEIFDMDIIGIDQDNLDERGNFNMSYMGPGKYYIMTELVATDGGRVHQFWEFSINNGPIVHELNICGNDYNAYHKIRIIGATMWLPPMPQLRGLDEPFNPCD